MRSRSPLSPRSALGLGRQTGPGAQDTQAVSDGHQETQAWACPAVIVCDPGLVPGLLWPRWLTCQDRGLYAH